MVKVSKAAKARIKRMSAAEKNAIQKAAKLLADAELISHGRVNAIFRTVRSSA